MYEGGHQHFGKEWFVWGIVLAGFSSIPLVVLFFNAFRGISQEKATGLAAVAGGLAEGYATFGLVLSFILPVVAIVLLCRSFPAGNRVLKIFSVLSIGWSALMLVLYSLCAWFFFVEMPHLTGPR